MHGPAAHRVARSVILIAAISGLALPSGCRGPISDRSEEDLRISVLEALKREVESYPADLAPQSVTRDRAVEDLEIESRYLDEIDRDYNPNRYYGESVGGQIGATSGLAGENLLGGATETVTIGLRRAVRSAVERNLTAQEASLAPAIAESQIAAAESAFDWVFFNDLIWQDQDTPQAGAGFTGLGETINSQQSVSNATGLRRSLVTGGQFSVQNELVYSDVRQSGFGSLPSPNPSSAASIDFQLDQPLLRGFGSDVALAQVRLARNAERGAIASLKSRLISVVTETESAYWDLVQTQAELLIVSKQLERGEKVRDDIKARRVLDAVQAQVADAVATVESRKADVLRAQRALRRASDRLKVLMNDPELPVGTETLLLPSDDALDEPLAFSLLDEIETAIGNRPEVDTALLAIDDASIREVVAENGLLPQLDLRAQASLLGFDDNAGSAYGEIGQGEFLDEFLLGLFFEQPIGNRGPEAEFRRRRLERMQSVVTYRRTVQEIVHEVKIALDDVVTNYKLIEQAKASRIASAEALRTLLVEKELTDRGFTVERLDLELGQQDGLAAAERAEIQALIDYNTSIARLREATGTTLRRNRINFVVPDVNQLEPFERASEIRSRDSAQ